MKQVFRIISESVMKHCFTEIVKQYKDGQVCSVIITDQNETRSQAQNRLYWLWLKQIEDSTGQDDEDLHVMFKRKFLAKIYARDDGEMAQLFESLNTLKRQPNYEQEVALPFAKRFLSTTQATTAQFSEYLNEIEVWAFGRGIPLKIPEDLRWIKDDRQRADAYHQRADKG